MTWPLEGSREIDEGIIISEPMDWCKSPTAIVQGDRVKKCVTTG